MHPPPRPCALSPLELQVQGCQRVCNPSVLPELTHSGLMTPALSAVPSQTQTLPDWAGNLWQLSLCRFGLDCSTQTSFVYHPLLQALL